MKPKWGRIETKAWATGSYFPLGTVLLIAMVALMLPATVQELRAESEIPFSRTRMIIEYNSSADDIGGRYWCSGLSRRRTLAVAQNRKPQRADDPGHHRQPQPEKTGPDRAVLRELGAFACRCPHRRILCPLSRGSLRIRGDDGRRTGDRRGGRIHPCHTGRTRDCLSFRGRRGKP